MPLSIPEKEPDTRAAIPSEGSRGANDPVRIVRKNYKAAFSVAL
jgi:hypothetical protein